MRRFLAVVVGLAASAGIAAAHTRPHRLPCTGRFVVQPSPILLGADATPIALVVVDGAVIRLDEACHARAKLRRTGKGTRLRALVPGCPGVKKRLRVAAVLNTNCDAISGTMKSKGQGKRPFAGTRSRCGDGFVDAGRNERCDVAGCADGMACDPMACTCSYLGTTTSTTTTTTIGPVADIAITGASMNPSSPAADDVLDISLQITSLGQVEIVDAVISVFIEIGHTAYGRPSQSLPTVSLAPGETTTVPFKWPLLPEFANKDARIYALADTSNLLAEANEQNNRWDFGVRRIEPTVPFVCQGSTLVLDVLSGESYACFDIRESTLAEVQQAISASAARVLLYGSYAVLDCPASLLQKCYARTKF